MVQTQIINSVNAFLTGTLDIDPSLVTPETELRRDIGMSSVDIMAIGAFIQKTFRCPLIMPEIKAILTLQDLYDYIERNTEN